MSDRVFGKQGHAEGWVSVTPLPTAAELHDFYATLYYQNPQSNTYQVSYSNLDLRYKRLKCASLLHALGSQGLQAGDAFLDVGAGKGFLMDAADTMGCAVTGLDFSSYAVEKFFPRLKSKLIAGDLFEVIGHLGAEGKRFKACSAINVLDHVIDPDSLLPSMREIIEPGGSLAITVPNDYSRLQALLHEEGIIDRDSWFAPPQHLHYFNAENLPRFCESRGYELVDAFADFPIELYLLHPGSNYVTDPAKGPAAHRARMLHDLLIAEGGLEPYLAMCRALFSAGIGRDITVILRPVGG